MNHRTALNSPLGVVPSISLRAEVLLLLVITIFGIIGLSVCLGAYGDGSGYASDATSAQIEQIAHVRQVETSY